MIQSSDQLVTGVIDTWRASFLHFGSCYKFFGDWKRANKRGGWRVVVSFSDDVKPVSGTHRQSENVDTKRNFTAQFPAPRLLTIWLASPFPCKAFRGEFLFFIDADITFDRNCVCLAQFLALLGTFDDNSTSFPPQKSIPFKFSSNFALKRHATVCAFPETGTSCQRIHLTMVGRAVNCWML